MYKPNTSINSAYPGQNAASDQVLHFFSYRIYLKNLNEITTNNPLFRNGFAKLIRAGIPLGIK